MEMMIWNIVLTSLVGIMIWVLKEKFSELDRLGILLNRTREEIAREHITRKEVRDDMEKIIQRFDDGFQRLESKIDKLVDERSIAR
jgi:Skp family chaperone for outer membrane proteins